jgi:GcrA cell cycle regulator
MDWTEQRVAELQQLWREGLSTAEIGKRLGITKNAVVGKAHRMGLSSRPSPILKREPAPAPQIVTLGVHSCRWPIGEPGKPGFRFCTSRAVMGKPYCGEHCAMAYARPKQQEEHAA